MPVVVIAVIIALIVFFFWKRRMDPATYLRDKKYFISTSGQSRERIQKLDLDKKTEDHSAILNINRLNFSDPEPEEEEDYGPDEILEWVIDIQPTSSNSIFTKKELWNLFDYDWRTKWTGATPYGFDTDEKSWTFVISGGNAETYSSLKVGCNLREMFEGGKPPNAQTISSYLEGVTKKFEKFRFPVTIRHRISIHEAVGQATKIRQLLIDANTDATIVLRSESNFYNGQKCWQTLVNLGLTWGDGDLFHWDSPFAAGDDQLFSVYTTTDPGYFLPEEVKANRFHPRDLLFGFSIPRSVDPENVLLIMEEAAKYCQSKLGGQLVDNQREPLDMGKLKKQVAAVVQRLKAENITPGSGDALFIFH